MSNIEQVKENRHMELLIHFYKNMGEDKYKLFTYQYFMDAVKGLDMSDRLKDHYFDKLEDMKAIRALSLTLDDCVTYRLDYIVSDLLKELNIK